MVMLMKGEKVSEVQKIHGHHGAGKVFVVGRSAFSARGWSSMTVYFS